MSTRTQNLLQRFLAPTKPKSKLRLQFLPLEDRVTPATFTVLNDLDSGAGSLRQAVADANLAAGADTIDFDPLFFSGTDKIISLTSGLTIDASHDLTISNPAGASQVTLNRASGSFGFFTTSSTLTIDGLTMTGATGGTAGAVNMLTAAANVVVKNSVITGNSGTNAGAINLASGATGMVTVENSTISNNTGQTGGIYYFGGGSLLVKNSTLTGNVGTAANGWEGGAIVFYGAVGTGGVTIENSTLHGNTSANATAGGGGIAFSNATGAATIRNSTITGNIAPAGAVGGAGVGVGYGTGGIALTIQSSIIAQNTGNATGPDLRLGNSSATATNSLIGVLPPTLFTSGSGTITGTSGSPLNPLLLPLADYGGPTRTRLPDVGSPVLEVGANPNSLTADQRGVGRVVGAIDMGAVERQTVEPIPFGTLAAPLTNVTAPGGTSYSVSVTFTDPGGTMVGMNVATIMAGNVVRITGPGGLNQLVPFDSIDNGTNGTPRTAVYKFTPPGGSWDSTDTGTYTFSIENNIVKDLDGLFVAGSTLGSFTVVIPQELMVTTDADSGAGSLRDAITQINANTSPGIITFDPGFFNTSRTISLDTALPTFTLAGGAVTIAGPGASLLTIERSTTATGGDFRIFNSTAPSFNLSGVRLANGVAATGNGGGILSSGILTVDSVVFENNSATGNAFGAGSGGAIALAGTSFLNLQNSTISGNTAQRSGGAIYFFSGGSLLMENSTISGNTTTDAAPSYIGGGAVYFFGTASASPPPGFNAQALTIANSTIVGNTTASSGGAVNLAVFTGILFLLNSTVTGNTAVNTTAGYGGGGIFTYAPTFVYMGIYNSIVSGNTNANGADILTDVAPANSNGGVFTSFSAIGDTSTFTENDGTGNIAPGTDLMLGLLADNGGPTMTMAPQPGSPLIDAGDDLNAFGLLDQLGGTHDRISGTAVDIGAYEVQPAKVTVEKAVGQADPTNIPTAVFDVVFNVPVTGFDITDVVLTSNVGGAVTGFTGSGTTYQVTVTGMSGQGTVSIAVPPDVALDGSLKGNAASTSVDNEVEFDTVGSTSTIELQVGQNDVTNVNSVDFLVTFNEPVFNFDDTDISTAGTTAGGVLVTTVTQLTATTFNINVSGMASDGVVVVNFVAGAANDFLGNTSVAPTIVDNEVTFDITAPNVTINKAAGQADPVGGSTGGSVSFTVVFDEAVSAFDGTMVDLSASTAPGTLVATVSGTGPTYTVTVTGMTGSGDVIASIPANATTDLAGNFNTVSTSTDNVVEFVNTGIVQLDAATYSISEEDSPLLTVQVSRTGGSDGPLSVDIATVFGSAIAADVDAFSDTLSWLAGDTSTKTILIQINDDSIVEPTETFTINLSNVSFAGALGTPSTATVSITDYEEGVVGFSAPTYAASEGGNATITINRTGGTDGALSVDYAMVLGTASASDHGTLSIPQGTVTFADGDATPIVITLPITNDTLSEGRETINFNLSNNTVGLLGTSAAVLTIAPSDPVSINFAGGFKPLTFLDTDQDKITVALGGKLGSADVYKTNDQGPISLIVLTGTDPAKSTLTVKVTKASKTVNAAANGTMSIGEISGTGVKTITALKSDLVGDGINLTGSLLGLKMANILNGADVTVAGSTLQKSAITLSGIIGDGTAITMGSVLNALTALSIGDGSITAPSAGKITAKGSTAVVGNFKSDITLSGANVDHTKLKKTLGALNVAGTLEDSTVNVTGHLGSVTVKGDVLDSAINGFSLTKVAVAGNFTNTDVTLTGANVNHAKKGKTLSGVAVKKLVDDSDFNVTGNIGSFTSYGFTDSRLFGGYTGADNGTGAFNGTVKTTIGSFKTLANAKAVPALTGAFANSSVIADTITAVTLATVTTNNGGADPFGIYADTAYTSVYITATKTKFLGKTTTTHTDGDFSIKIV